MKLIIFLSIFFITITFAEQNNFIHYKEAGKYQHQTNDIYHLVYNPKRGCHLFKNKKEIPLVSAYFKGYKHSSFYTCSVIQRENYLSCITRAQSRVSSQFLSYGVYPEVTNFLVGIKAIYPKLSSTLTIECSKQKKLY